MNEPTWFHHVDGTGLGPFIQSLPVYTLVRCGVCDWLQVCGGPLECDEPDVAVAHGCLAEEVEAVFWGNLEFGGECG